MGKHERPGKSDEWYTPKYIFDAMGVAFDLDVAAPEAGPLHTPASEWFFHDSLRQLWFGFVWMNPPFGKRNGITPWLSKFLHHGDGVALTPDRTSAPWFLNYMRFMDALLFVSPKIHFIPGPGAKASNPAQGTCLSAKGPHGVRALQNAAAKNLGLLVYPAKAHG